MTDHVVEPLGQEAAQRVGNLARAACPFPSLAGAAPSQLRVPKDRRTADIVGILELQSVRLHVVHAHAPLTGAAAPAHEKAYFVGAGEAELGLDVAPGSSVFWWVVWLFSLATIDCVLGRLACRVCHYQTLKS